MKQGRASLLIVTTGCPSGIGPEVCLRAVVEGFEGNVVLVGDGGALRAAARTIGVAETRLLKVDGPNAVRRVSARSIRYIEPTAPLVARDRRPGKPTNASGEAQLRWIDYAFDAVMNGHASAMVTGPVSKEVIAKSGSKRAKTFFGHTEYLQQRANASEVTMAFACPQFTTALVSTHLPLKKVPLFVTKERVVRAITHLVNYLRPLGRARVCVAALNPHAGERGLLGTEERDVIAPAVEIARRSLSHRGSVTIEGPTGAESAFRRAANGDFDGVVAMYHDQATIPTKLLAFGDAVNVTLGLPFVRTSVDHGTGYDRAGKGTADARGMIAALELAARLSG